MIGAERFDPDSPSRAVAEHLHQVHAAARGELDRVEMHQRLMHRLIVCWLDRLSDDRRTIDRFTAAGAVAHAAWPRPPASHLSTVHGDVAQLMGDLARFGWLDPVRTGHDTFWRAQIGVRFVPAELHHKEQAPWR